jgi:hypothetical protein
MGNRRGWFARGAVAVYVTVVLALGGCGRDRSSRIVRLVEDAGAGDLRTVSVGSMIQWLDRHPALALKVENLCIDVRKNPLAAWPETTEGRLCNAASRVVGYIVWQRSLEEDNDHKSFQGGSK